GVLAFTVLLLVLERRGGSALDRVISRTLQARLVRRPGAARRHMRVLLLGLAGALLVVALMRPQWGIEFQSTPRVGSELMVCLDVSRSMLAEDVAPNRLERAKAEVRDLLPFLEGDHVGLTAFAGRATVLSPLTPDFGFLRLALDGAGTHSVSRGGTRLEEPIRKALAGFGDTSEVSRAILLITDGEDHDSFPMEAAKAAAERGIKIIAIGFGSEEGSEIAITDRETGARRILEHEGHTVRTRLDGDTLREMALVTEGAYIPAGTGALDLESIYGAHISPLTRGRLDGRGRAVRREGFQWAVLLGLISLLGSVAMHGGRPRRGRNAIAAPPRERAAAALLVAARVAPSTVAAQESRPAGAAKAAETTATPEEARDDAVDGVAEAPPGESTGGSEAPHRAHPRDAFNDGFARLAANDLDAAEQLFDEARRRAGTDGELRFRCTYDIGCLTARRADSALDEKPEEALRLLRAASDWFREAIRLRPKSADSRHNLEVVMRRAIALADSLARKDEEDLTARLDAIIERQRGLSAPVRALVERQAAAQSHDPHAADAYKREFRAAATEERLILSDTVKLSEGAGVELDAIQGKAEEERAPEERMRAAQLEGVLHYLHRGRERMGQARRLLRRRQGERAWRDAFAALTELKRARDQLRDPLE
ncbi:MAG: VWA domain-containing protein, partial [Planctomycetota bacterium]